MWAPGDPLYDPDETLWFCPECKYPIFEMEDTPGPRCSQCGYWAQKDDGHATWEMFYARHIELTPKDEFDRMVYLTRDVPVPDVAIPTVEMRTPT